MQTAFREEMFSILLCNLDEVLVFSATVAEQIQRIDTVFTRLTEYGLKVGLKNALSFSLKCSILGIATDPEKIAAVEHWPRPGTL